MTTTAPHVVAVKDIVDQISEKHLLQGKANAELMGDVHCLCTTSHHCGHGFDSWTSHHIVKLLIGSLLDPPRIPIRSWNEVI